MAELSASCTRGFSEFPSGLGWVLQLLNMLLIKEPTFWLSKLYWTEWFLWMVAFFSVWGDKKVSSQGKVSDDSSRRTWRQVVGG